MARYFIHTETHEVHTYDCKHLPDEKHRRGFNANSDGEAIKKAKQRYHCDANGCKHCLPKYDVKKN